jgi:hypothetical protein
MAGSYIKVYLVNLVASQGRNRLLHEPPYVLPYYLLAIQIAARQCCYTTKRI